MRARRGDVFQITKDTVATSVYKKLTAYGTALEQKLTGTDGQFKKRAVQDIRMQILLAFMDQYFGIDHKGTEATKKEWAATYSKMLEYAGMEQPEMTTKQQPGNRNESHQMVFDWYKKNLKGRVQEAAMAHIILEDDHNERFTTNMPDLYGQFKALHPASALQAPLEAAIQRNLSFNNLELPADIHILNTDSVRSLKEITDRYLGKVIFVDIWATWCGPCRQSFAHVAPLQEYAKKNDIVLLYISIDQPSETGLWKKMAGYYHLKGEHAIVNEAFRTDIYNTFGNKGALYIPHCAIINKKGELQFKTASSPEKMDKLIEQLQEAAGKYYRQIIKMQVKNLQAQSNCKQVLHLVSLVYHKRTLFIIPQSSHSLPAPAKNGFGSDGRVCNSYSF